jgi:hypothetical protein
MGEQDNANLVKQAYEQFRNGNIAAVLDLCADDIEWELPATANVPFSGKRHGRDQVEEFFRQLDQMQQAQQFEPREFIAQGDTVVAIGHYAWLVKATGRTFESDWAHVFRIRNGKLSSFREYADTLAAAEAYQQDDVSRQGIGADTAQTGGTQPTLH